MSGYTRDRSDPSVLSKPAVEETLAESSGPFGFQTWVGPFNEGTLDHPEGSARITGPCGDTMEISLRIQGEQIVDARFRVIGCANSRACASMAAALAKGRTLDEAWDIDEKAIRKRVKGLPAREAHCALLARDALHQAIEQYIRANREGKMLE